MKQLSVGIFCAFLLLGVTGCGINFYAGRSGDVSRIHQLSAQLEQLRAQKEKEANQLREAKVTLEKELQSEIRDKRVKLEMAERGLVLTFVSEVLFDSGKNSLRTEALESLEKVASVIREKVPDREIGIEGHTDNEPIERSSWKSNWELSTGRATSVLHHLEESGVNPQHLVALGYGEYRPVASNSTHEGRRKNRRVEIVILPKKLTRTEQDLVRQGWASGEPEAIQKAQALEQYK